VHIPLLTVSSYELFERPSYIMLVMYHHARDVSTQCDRCKLISLSARRRLQHLTVAVADRDDNYDNFTKCSFLMNFANVPKL